MVSVGFVGYEEFFRVGYVVHIPSEDDTALETGRKRREEE